MTQQLFENFQKKYTPIIEQYLHHFLPKPINDNRNWLRNAMEYSLKAGGKRIRPLLTIASYQLFKDTITPILPVATAIEMIHTYSLIHDDLPAMDDDDLRRGKKTCHKAYDEATAILAGDSLNTLAFELLVKNLPQSFTPETTLIAIQELTEACGLNGLAGGQTLDLQSENSPDSNNNIEELSQIHDLKTGSLIKVCLTIPAILVQTPQSDQTSLSDYGKYIGRLFQITDDILDVTQTSEILGKSAAKDIKQNKLTYVSLYGLEGAQKQAEETARLAETALNHLNYDASLLKAFINKILYRIQ